MINEINLFVDNFRSVLLGTLTVEGEPSLSYSPFVKHDGKNYIYISEVADHYINLVKDSKLEVMFIEDESLARDIIARKRMKYKAVAHFIDREANYFEDIMDTFEKKIGASIKIVRKMKDFHLIELDFIKGTYVGGFGKAYMVDEKGEASQVTKDVVHDMKSKR